LTEDQRISSSKFLIGNGRKIKEGDHVVIELGFTDQKRESGN
jgi:hypothetical protein